MFNEPLFHSFFIAGFESSCHRLRCGKRLDLSAATGHATHVKADYARLQEQGIFTVRDGIRWHLVEPSPGCYDFSSVLPMFHAVRDTGVQVIWDLCHFGWPDDIDVFKPAFVQRFALLARAFTKVLVNETDAVPFFVPITEASFVSWAGGDVAYLNPFASGRGFELKAQLVRAVIEGIEAIWSVDPKARIVHSDPLVHIIPDLERPSDPHIVEALRQAQYQAWDMVSGRLWPQLGGGEQYLCREYACILFSTIPAGMTIATARPAYGAIRMKQGGARYTSPWPTNCSAARRCSLPDAHTLTEREMGSSLHRARLYIFPGTTSV